MDGDKIWEMDVTGSPKEVGMLIQSLIIMNPNLAFKVFRRQDKICITAD
jgi:hypothetical protein